MTRSADRPDGPRPFAWWRWLWRPVLVLTVTGVLGWWMWNGAWFSPRSRPEPEPAAVSVDAPMPEPPRAWTPRKAVEPAPGCAPEASRRCYNGDAWWLDSCGVMYAQAQDCGTRMCDQGECEPPPPPDCGGVPPLGECRGTLAVGCDAGYPFEVDCGAILQRCVLTEEGPACRLPSPDDCEPDESAPTCDGDTLRTCVEGRWESIDCRMHGGVCGRPPGALANACVRSPPPTVVDDACEDACGCAPPPTDEVCDGRDNDDDGFIDESGTCEPVDLVAFVIVDSDSQGSYTRQDIDDEVVRLNRLFSRDDDYGLDFRLVDVVRLAEPQWLTLDAERLDDLVRSPTIIEAREDFYVPIIFTDRIMYRGSPRPGLSTVPNGTCGGQRRIQGPQPPLGVIAIAKRRWETTVAHELGHFFGLCHTHADHPAPIVTVADLDADPHACAEPCSVDGDGLCDTPEDPGPNQCSVDIECGPSCGDGSGPDTTNIMGYYADCRVGFSEQQALLMRQTLALRRAWHPCLRGRGCPCELATPGCPESMSCRRYTDDDGRFEKCWFDGPAPAGGVCASSLQCSNGAICVRQVDDDARCVRPCTDQTPACNCVDLEGIEQPICVDDLRRE